MRQYFGAETRSGFYSSNTRSGADFLRYSDRFADKMGVWWGPKTRSEFLNLSLRIRRMVRRGHPWEPILESAFRVFVRRGRRSQK